MTATDSPLLDQEIVVMLRQLDAFDHLVPKFLDMLTGQVTALRQALALGERQTARQLAHRLRGSSDQMGAVALARAFAAIEAATGKDGTALAGLDAGLEELAAATGAVLRRSVGS